MTAKIKKQVRVTQKGSAIGCTVRQRRTLKGLGLGRIGRTAVLADNPSVRGMIAKVRHLVTAEEDGHE